MKVDEADRTRPYAYADPRSLSQAWYDALYGSRAKPQAPKATESSASHVAGNAAAADNAEMPPGDFASPERSGRLQDVTSGSEAQAFSSSDEDLETLVMRARFKDREPVRRAEAPRSERTDLEIDDGNGTAIKLLIAQRGADLEVVAVCKRESRERAADALARARIALGARGITMHTEIREKNEGEAR